MGYATSTTPLEKRQVKLVYIGAFAIALLEVLIKYAGIALGNSRLWYDAREVWYPAATAVLEGTPLYTDVAADNKPPLFEFLNVAVAATGEYALVFHGLVGIANAVTAILLYHFVANRASASAGIIAALFYLAVLPLINGTIINVRSFAAVGILAALHVQHPAAKGALLAGAGLFSQSAVFAIPVVVYTELRDRESHLWLLSFITAGLGVVTISYLAVFGIWGQEAFIGGIEESLLVQGYFSQGERGLGSPTLWLARIVYIVSTTLFVLVPAGLYAALKIREGVQHGVSWDFEWELLAFTGIFLLPLLVRSLHYYWVLPMLFLAALAGISVTRLSRHQLLS